MMPILRTASTRTRRFAAALGDLAQAREIAADRVGVQQPLEAFGRSPSLRSSSVAPITPSMRIASVASSSVLAFSAAWYTASLRPRSSRPAALPSSRRRRRRCRYPASASSDFRVAADADAANGFAAHGGIRSSGPSAAGSRCGFRRIDLTQHEQGALLDQRRLRPASTFLMIGKARSGGCAIRPSMRRERELFVGVGARSRPASILRRLRERRTDHEQRDQQCVV